MATDIRVITCHLSVHVVPIRTVVLKFQSTSLFHWIAELVQGGVLSVDMLEERLEASWVLRGEGRGGGVVD